MTEYGEYTNGDAVDILINEGYDYAVRHYTSGDQFADVETRRLWNAAGDAMEALLTYLEKQTGRNADDE